MYSKLTAEQQRTFYGTKFVFQGRKTTVLLTHCNPKCLAIFLAHVDSLGQPQAATNG